MTLQVTAAEFLDIFTEFRTVSVNLCQEKLNTASLLVNEEAFGDQAKTAIMYKAAHLLSLSPSGEQARLRIQNRGTMYGTEYDRIARAAVFGMDRTA